MKCKQRSKAKSLFVLQQFEALLTDLDLYQLTLFANIATLPLYSRFPSFHVPRADCATAEVLLRRGWHYEYSSCSTVT